MIRDLELTCPECRRPDVLQPVYPPRCGACGWSGEVSALVASGRSRARQYPPGRYPESVPFR